MTPPGQSFSAPAADILERMREGFYAIDDAWRFRYVNAAAEDFWKTARQELLGRSMLDVFPRFPGSKAFDTHKQAFDGRCFVRAEVISTATGLPVELCIYPDDGGISIYFQDLSRRLDLERKLSERDELLSMAEMSAGVGVWDIDLTSQTLIGTPHFFGLYGLEPRTEPVAIDVVRGLRHPEDDVRVADAFEQAIAAGAEAFEAEYRVIRPDERTLWVFGRGRILRDASGSPVRYTGVDIDITERKRHEEQLRLVTHELRHRANNLLAVIQAMARQTLRASSSLEDFEARFDGRVRALADSNQLLVAEDWRGIPLKGLVLAQLVPFAERDGERFLVTGPRVDVVPKAVQTLGLALHELATNASKYGALSVPTGTIGVTWTLERRTGEPWLRLEWTETGGPPVSPPERTGFGTFVTEEMVAQSLGAEVRSRFEASGLQWTMACRAADVILD